ncbi:MAG: hypothetical protein FWE58_05965, partial [Methanobrevibacter sp.]|nr:hypothetical protein [Methanobrevibacter sp.]
DDDSLSTDDSLNSDDDSLSTDEDKQDSNSEEHGPPKISYLDTFTHLINKNQTKKPGIGDLREAEHDDSPTLNVSNSSNIEKKDFKYKDNKKPITTWKKRE